MSKAKVVQPTLHAIPLDKFRRMLKCYIKDPRQGVSVTAVDGKIIDTYGPEVLLMPASEDSIRKPWQKKAVPDWGSVSASVLEALNQRTTGRKP